jgi:hypothetical protein
MIPAPGLFKRSARAQYASSVLFGLVLDVIAWSPFVKSLTLQVLTGSHAAQGGLKQWQIYGDAVMSVNFGSGSQADPLI